MMARRGVSVGVVVVAAVALGLAVGSAEALDSVVWVRSATTEAAVPGATCTVAQTGVSGTTDGNGKVQLFTGVSPGTTTIACSADGFTPHARDIHIPSHLHNVFIYLNPSLAGESNVARIVLEWGEDPRDLDARLISSSSGSLSYSTRTITEGDMELQLDVDDTNGFGPETITVRHPRAQWYHYVVHKYSGSNDLEEADATIAVYSSDDASAAVRTYEPPRSSRDTDYYHPFSLRTQECTKPNGVRCQATYIIPGRGYLNDWVSEQYAPQGGDLLMAGCVDGSSSTTCDFPEEPQVFPINDDDDDDRDGRRGKNDGTAVGVVIVVVAIIVAAALACCCCCRRKAKLRAQNAARREARRNSTAGPITLNLSVNPGTGAAAGALPFAAPADPAVQPKVESTARPPAPVPVYPPAPAAVPVAHAPAPAGYAYPPAPHVVHFNAPPHMVLAPDMAVAPPAPPVAPLPMAPIAGSVAAKDVKA